MPAFYFRHYGAAEARSAAQANPFARPESKGLQNGLVGDCMDFSGLVELQAVKGHFRVQRTIPREFIDAVVGTLIRALIRAFIGAFVQAFVRACIEALFVPGGLTSPKPVLKHISGSLKSYFRFGRYFLKSVTGTADCIWVRRRVAVMIFNIIIGANKKSHIEPDFEYDYQIAVP